MKQTIQIFLVLVLASQSLLVFGQNPAHEQWKADRKAELLGENGWVNLIGLLWIDQENNFLNQVSEDSLSISNKAGKKNIGSFHLVGDSVWFHFNPKVVKKSKPELLPKTLQFPVENYSQGGVYFHRWKWSVIKRGENFAVRLRDLEHPALEDFKEIPVYDFAQNWSIPAFFEPKFNQTIDIPNVLGQIVEWKVMGILKFEVDGVKQEVIAFEDGGKLFVIFADVTSGKETYPTGRYLHVNYPDRSGNTTIDFNFSYNPPCAFTAFATCPIPPKENRLNFKVEAGEKVPEGH
ncbi:DUF1684 domain-containing protein [Algoriphagus sp. A40]|uniref:DUF1684 domain-containing protein n=1 Tax=Algoriphagus sp. A40 TaxID=1945863 RepID=UPI0009865347|nr:DUF1684 domain-containing protein [Algoriphagus sp. A40]OOG73750.1 hypothetical protein B0E43_12945 [Algoriphagus sp. A40]